MRSWREKVGHRQWQYSIKPLLQTHQKCWSVYQTFYAAAGYPAITVPLGLGKAGEPNGVTFIGKHGGDAKLLADAFEQATH